MVIILWAESVNDRKEYNDNNLNKCVYEIRDKSTVFFYTGINE